MNSINHHIKDGTLYVNNTPVEFKYPAYKAIEMNSIIVVLLDTQPIEVFNENIFCVNSSGEIIWQIQDRPNLKLGGLKDEVQRDCLYRLKFGSKLL